jgi:hypothetical protein
MSAQTETVTYDTLFSTVARARKSRISDNIGNSQPTLDLFHAAGKVEEEVGGESIEERIMYAYQDAEWMSERQSVDTDDKEMITTAVYPWRFALSPVNIAKTDELRAQASKTAAITFAESKSIGARQGLRTAINTAMNAAATGKAMLGNQDLVRDSVSVGTLGGIDLSVAANSFFRNQAYTSAVTVTAQTVANIFNGWDQIGAQVEAASDINEEVTHIAAGSTLYHKLLSTLEGQGYVRFGARDKAQLGAGGQRVGSGPAFRGAMVYKDRAVAASHIYGYNINTMKLKIMKGANFAKTPFVRADATGVLAMVGFYLVGIQFVALNPRRNFVMTNVS